MGGTHLSNPLDTYIVRPTQRRDREARRSRSFFSAWWCSTLEKILITKGAPAGLFSLAELNLEKPPIKVDKGGKTPISYLDAKPLPKRWINPPQTWIKVENESKTLSTFLRPGPRGKRVSPPPYGGMGRVPRQNPLRRLCALLGARLRGFGVTKGAD